MYEVIQNIMDCVWCQYSHYWTEWSWEM